MGGKSHLGSKCLGKQMSPEKENHVGGKCLLGGKCVEANVTRRQMSWGGNCGKAKMKRQMSSNGKSRVATRKTASGSEAKVT